MAEQIATALSAYANAAKMLPTPGLGPRDGAGESFSQLLQNATNSAIDTLKGSEKTSLEGVMGKADIAQVATALANADATLQTVVAVRDKVIAAYQDIIKMTI
ncbi:MAG TPA: flagellar hook-basal body complex protein FliE [Stellaceae bacterium]|nr:flagellar hook-basal body complex protein FliE [Stellaceae bacterium]